MEPSYSHRFQDLTVNSPGMLEILREIKTTVETGTLSEAAAKAQEALKLLKNTKLNIAITGESGSGKSSFINAMRGLKDDDEGAAKVDVTEATMKPTPYPYPNHSNVTMWDLPGIGTLNFRSDTYLQQVKFTCYDFFIIVASERFKCTHAELAWEIQKMGKKFYFVRSKVDGDMENEKRKRNFNKEKTLEKIRDDCVQKLQKEGVSSPQVFLVSRWNFSKYDGCKLQETLADELDGHKKDVFLLALQNISRPILEKKKGALEKEVWKRALLSCTIGAVPIPFLCIKCDVDILVKSITEYYKAFGLGDNPLPLLAMYIEKPVPKVEATGISFVITYAMLQMFLDDVAEEAESVLTSALAADVKKSERLYISTTV
uniref:IRG-type G domain-containing protein n=1 Tax=Pelusios castaneus TaxID=367368 RepID=A0A8C8SB69_9SAUR